MLRRTVRAPDRVERLVLASWLGERVSASIPSLAMLERRAVVYPEPEGERDEDEHGDGDVRNGGDWV